MDASDLLRMLWLASWTSSLALLVVLLLRSELRRWFGSGIAYASWLVVPMTLLAAALPTPTRTLPALPVLGAPASVTSVVPVTVPMAASTDWPFIAMCAWLAGVLAMSLHLVLRQRRFLRTLGPLECIDAGQRLWRARQNAGLPALVGLWHPRIVLPADVDARYTASERALMIAHEQLHARRGDGWVNAAVALGRALFWFNPLVHFAAGRLLHDQEMACDARVLATRPGSGSHYAEAMLKTCIAAHASPLGCHWGATHPLKERIMQLKHIGPAARRQRWGLALVIFAMAASGYAAWSVQPTRWVTASHVHAKAPAPAIAVQPASRSRTVQVSTTSRVPADIQLDLQLSLDGGEPEHMTLVTGAGQPFNVRLNDDGSDVQLRGELQPVVHEGRPAYRLSMQLRRKGQAIAAPVLVALAGKPASVQIGEAPGGGSRGIELTARIGPVSPEVKQAVEDAEAAAREAGQAADAAVLVADDAARAALEAMRTSEATARAAEQMARGAEIEATASARAADVAARDASREADASARSAAHEADAAARHAAREAEVSARNAAREAEAVAREAMRRAESALHAAHLP